MDSIWHDSQGDNYSVSVYIFPTIMYSVILLSLIVYLVLSHLTSIKWRTWCFKSSKDAGMDWLFFIFHFAGNLCGTLLSFSAGWWLSIWLACWFCCWFYWCNNRRWCCISSWTNSKFLLFNRIIYFPGLKSLRFKHKMYLYLNCCDVLPLWNGGAFSLLDAHSRFFFFFPDFAFQLWADREVICHFQVKRLSQVPCSCNCHWEIRI